jgi:hypothetical protein
MAYKPITSTVRLGSLEGQAPALWRMLYARVFLPAHYRLSWQEVNCGDIFTAHLSLTLLRCNAQRCDNKHVFLDEIGFASRYHVIVIFVSHICTELDSCQARKSLFRNLG